MNVLVAGLSPRDEAAFGFFLSRSLKGWSWASTPAGRGTVLPKADLLVADLVALGLAQWSVAAEAELLRVLQGNTAVLLVPANDQTWATMDPATVKQNSLVWLHKPYGTEDMREALERAATARRALNTVAVQGPSRVASRDAPVGSTTTRTERVNLAPPVTAKAAPAGKPPPSIRAVLPTVSFRAAPAPELSPRHEAGDEVPGLSVQQLQARLGLLPDVERHLFLRRLASMLGQGQPFEARFTMQNSVIFHPADGWVASNTPTSVIERVCQSDALAAAVSVREIDGPQAEERAQRLGMPPLELDTFLWTLAAAALDRRNDRPAEPPRR